MNLTGPGLPRSTHWPGRAALAALVRVAGMAAVGCVMAIAVAACISEGCMYPDELGVSTSVAFELDAQHPAAASHVTVSLASTALPSAFEGRGARLNLSLADAPDVTLTLVPDGDAVPIPVASGRGVTDVALSSCQPDSPCTVDLLAIVEWTKPVAGARVAATMTAYGLVRVPRTQELCGLPADSISVEATPPTPRRSAVAGIEQQAHDGSELVGHVTVALEGGAPPARPAADPVIARGHLAFLAPTPVEGAAPSAIAGLWLRVTADDGTIVLDGPVPASYPILPADATFPVLAGCPDTPCRNGYWIQAAAYDPTGHTPLDVAAPAFEWRFDASTTSPDDDDAAPATVRVDADHGERPPKSLVTTGDAGSFRIEPGHDTHTFVIDASIPGHDLGPLGGDALSQASIQFDVTSSRVAEPDPGTNGNGGQGGASGSPYLWLSNGHYLGDGSTADDRADTGGWGGPGTVPSPVGRPLAACAGLADACAARTGFVLARYDDVFGRDSAHTFDVRATWRVVGAPAGATIDVRTIDGATLDNGSSAVWPLPVVIAVVVLAGVGVMLAMRFVVRSRSRRRVLPPGP